MLKLDIKQMKFENQHNNNYSVRYVLYRNSNKKKKVNWNKELSKSCYSGVWSKLKSLPKNTDRLVTMFIAVKTSVTLTIEEACQWVEICKKHKLLPEYVKSSDCIRPAKIKGGLFECHLTLDVKDQYQNMIYMYLDTFRHLREDPGFVKSILYLHKKKNMNFYMAFVLASHLNIGGTGHHSLQVCKSCYSYNKPVPKKATDSLNLRAVRALYKFIHDTSVNRGLKFVPTTPGWNCNAFIAKLTNGDLTLPIVKLDLKTAANIVYEFDDKKAEILYNNYMKRIKKQ